jgi:hypothetical protein
MRRVAERRSLDAASDMIDLLSREGQRKSAGIQHLGPTAAPSEVSGVTGNSAAVFAVYRFFDCRRECQS